MKYKNFELKNDQDSFLTLVDEEGNEELCQIIFTFESEELGKKYVIFSRVSDIEKYYSSECRSSQITPVCITDTSYHSGICQMSE